MKMIFEPGATRLALEYEGWHGKPVDHGEHIDEGRVGDVMSIPKGQRLRVRKRGKSEGEVISECSSSLEKVAVGSDDDESDDENMALGSSCITSGSEGDEEGNETKKAKLDSDEEWDKSDDMDQDGFVFGDQEVSDVAPVTEDTRKEGNAMSSGVAGAFPLGNLPKEEEGTE